MVTLITKNNVQTNWLQVNHPLVFDYLDHAQLSGLTVCGQKASSISSLHIEGLFWNVTSQPPPSQIAPSQSPFIWHSRPCARHMIILECHLRMTFTLLVLFRWRGFSILTSTKLFITWWSIHQLHYYVIIKTIRKLQFRHLVIAHRYLKLTKITSSTS